MAQTSIPSGGPMAVSVKAGKRARRKEAEQRRYAPERKRDVSGKLLPEGRRYAPTKDDEAIGDVVDMSPYNDLTRMDEAALSKFALQNFGRRFQEGDTREQMVREIRQNMDRSRMARYA